MPDWITPAFWLSLVLAVAGCTGLILAGKGKWYGWALGLAIQPVWALFGIITGGYGLILTAAMYGAVYWTNLAKWRREVKTMGLTKHGSGKILPEPEDAKKTASTNWSAADEQALAEENEDADQR